MTRFFGSKEKYHAIVSEKFARYSGEDYVQGCATLRAKFSSLSFPYSLVVQTDGEIMRNGEIIDMNLTILLNLSSSLSSDSVQREGAVVSSDELVKAEQRGLR